VIPDHDYEIIRHRTGAWFSEDIIMGKVILNSETNADILQKTKMPVLFLSPFPALLPKQYERFSLNLPLAERLSLIPRDQRELRITDEIRDLLFKDITPLVLDHYEILFSPAYRLNILKIFSEIARIRPFYTQWAGKFRQNALTYAEPDDPEYRNYRITDYDVIVVQ